MSSIRTGAYPVGAMQYYKGKFIHENTYIIDETNFFEYKYFKKRNILLLCHAFYQIKTEYWTPFMENKEIQEEYEKLLKEKNEKNEKDETKETEILELHRKYIKVIWFRIKR